MCVPPAKRWRQKLQNASPPADLDDATTLIDDAMAGRMVCLSRRLQVLPSSAPTSCTHPAPCSRRAPRWWSSDRVSPRDRARCDALGVGARRRRPPPSPANEVAGFVIGAGLVGLVFAASRLDGIIAKAQVRGFEESKGERWRAETKENGGNIFVLPDDEEKK